ncbi:hypothetical protein LUZ60_004261 [Juncus effusus]|nr:hypothetical protein LUZ60_004261 [Juncus effusus]
MEEREFSFPIIATDQEISFPHFTSSPLWFFSPPKDDTNSKNASMVLASKPVQEAEFYKKLDEEKMDMLWEDLNEDVEGAFKRNMKQNFGSLCEFETEKDGRIVRQRKTASFVVMVKMLKRYLTDQKRCKKNKW